MQETKMIISKSFNEAIKEAEQLLIPIAKINNLTISKDEIFQVIENKIKMLEENIYKKTSKGK